MFVKTPTKPEHNLKSTLIAIGFDTNMTLYTKTDPPTPFTQPYPLMPRLNAPTYQIYSDKKPK